MPSLLCLDLDKSPQPSWGWGFFWAEKAKKYLLPSSHSSLRPSFNQKEAVLAVTEPAKEAQIQNPPPIQQEQAKEPETPKDTSSDKAAEVPKDGATSQRFEQALALTTLPAGGASTEKDKEVPLEAADKTPKAKLQIKVKP